MAASISNPSGDKICQFDKIYHDLEPYCGRLRLASSGVAWKSLVDGKLVTLKAAEIKRAYWCRVARLYELQLPLSDYNMRFNGFNKDDIFSLREQFKKLYNINIEQKELSVKGWNWGQVDFDGNTMSFNVDEKPAFELALNNVTNTNLVAKNEVSLEFSQNLKNNKEELGNSSKSQLDELVEIRFYVPNSAPKRPSDDKKIQENSDIENDENSEANQTSAEQFYETIKARAGLQISGEAICLFQEILLLTPRGRYDIDMFEMFFRLRGKTYDYKVPYTSITELFLLHRQDQKNVLFVIGVEPPLRQGQTKYPFLVMEISKTSEIDLELNFDSDSIIDKNLKNEQKNYEGNLYEVIKDIFQMFSKVKTSSESAFKSHLGFQCIKCSIKANEGYLYMLEDSFLFVPKNPVKINHSEIGTVVFSRVGGGAYLPTARTFDLRFNLRSGNQIQISSINKEEHPLIEEHLRSKNIKFKDELTDDNTLKQATQNYDVDLSSSEESEDEDFVEKSSSDVAEEFDENASDSSEKE